MELEEEAVAVPLLLPQAARIAVPTSKRKVTLTNVFSDSDVRFDIFFTSFHVYKSGNIPDNEMIRKAPCPSEYQTLMKILLEQNEKCLTMCRRWRPAL